MAQSTPPKPVEAPAPTKLSEGAFRAKVEAYLAPTANRIIEIIGGGDAISRNNIGLAGSGAHSKSAKVPAGCFCARTDKGFEILSRPDGTIGRLLPSSGEVVDL